MPTPPEFQPWPKIARLNRDIVITEKIDGTNAAIGIGVDEGEVWAQSRTRLITPDKDNFGFAGWVKAHEDTLRDILGPGLHFGEWWGLGIQRGYGLVERRFSLFNTSRWKVEQKKHDPRWIDGLDIVPVLFTGAMDTVTIENVLDVLRTHGSFAVPGYMKPEGIVVFHTAASVMFKVTLEGDEKPKGLTK